VVRCGQVLAIVANKLAFGTRGSEVQILSPRPTTLHPGFFTPALHAELPTDFPNHPIELNGLQGALGMSPLRNKRHSC